MRRRSLCRSGSPEAARFIHAAPGLRSEAALGSSQLPDVLIRCEIRSELTAEAGACRVACACTPPPPLPPDAAVLSQRFGGPRPFGAASGGLAPSQRGAGKKRQEVKCATPTLVDRRGGGAVVFRVLCRLF